MQIAILALGSRGDVQPFVALALGLQEKGHGVTIAAAADYAELVTAYGIAFVGVAGYVRELMDFALVNEMLDGTGNPLRFARKFLGEVTPLLAQIVADCWQIAQHADLLIVSTLGLFVGLHLIEKRQIEQRSCPLVAVHFHPLFPTPNAAHVNFPTVPTWLPGRGAYNLLTHHLGVHGMWQLLRRPFNRARQTVLDLPPLSVHQLYRRASQTVPTLFAYSAAVAPGAVNELPATSPNGVKLRGKVSFLRRQESIIAEWTPVKTGVTIGSRLLNLTPLTSSVVTGYWFLLSTPSWQPPTPLHDFLAAGAPPVLITFGSILGGRDPNRMTSLLVDALQKSGQRGLIYRGWGDLGNGPLPATVMAIDAVPHAWLLPQVAAVVHHGGAGTTAAALRANVPSVVVPVFGDQLFWAQRVQALGVATPPIPRRQLSSTNLAAAIQQTLTDPTMRVRRQQLATRLKTEDGVARAVTWLEEQMIASAKLL